MDTCDRCEKELKEGEGVYKVKGEYVCQDCYETLYDEAELRCEDK